MLKTSFKKLSTHIENKGYVRTGIVPVMEVSQDLNMSEEQVDALVRKYIRVNRIPIDLVSSLEEMPRRLDTGSLYEEVPDLPEVKIMTPTITHSDVIPHEIEHDKGRFDPNYVSEDDQKLIELVKEFIVKDTITLTKVKHELNEDVNKLMWIVNRINIVDAGRIQSFEELDDYKNCRGKFVTDESLLEYLKVVNQGYFNLPRTQELMKGMVNVSLIMDEYKVSESKVRNMVKRFCEGQGLMLDDKPLIKSFMLVKYSRELTSAFLEQLDSLKLEEEESLQLLIYLYDLISISNNHNKPYKTDKVSLFTLYTQLPVYLDKVYYGNVEPTRKNYESLQVVMTNVYNINTKGLILLDILSDLDSEHLSKDLIKRLTFTEEQHDEYTLFKSFDGIMELEDVSSTLDKNLELLMKKIQKNMLITLRLP